jgi:hypothetical protein
LPGDLAASIVAAVSVAVGCFVYLATLWLFFRARLRDMWAFVKVLRQRGAKDAAAGALAL